MSFYFKHELIIEKHKEERRMKKRLSAILVAALMLVTLFPMTAMAVDVQEAGATDPAPTFSLAMPGTETDLLGKTAADLGAGITFAVNEDKTITASGTLKYVTEYTGFWGDSPEHQEGYYLPFAISLPEGATAKLVSAVAPEERPLDDCGVFLLGKDIDTAKAKTITLKIDFDGAGDVHADESYTINVSGMTFEKKAITTDIVSELSLNFWTKDDFLEAPGVAPDSPALNLPWLQASYKRDYTDLTASDISLRFTVEKSGITADGNALKSWSDGNGNKNEFVDGKAVFTRVFAAGNSDAYMQFTFHPITEENEAAFGHEFLGLTPEDYTGSYTVTVDALDQDGEVLDTQTVVADYKGMESKATITRDPSPAGGTGGADCSFTPLDADNTVKFTGSVDWYAADEGLGRAAGNRVGVEIKPTSDVDLSKATFSIDGGAARSWGDEAQLWWYPLLTEANLATPKTITIDWDGDEAEYKATTYTVDCSGVTKLYENALKVTDVSFIDESNWTSAVGVVPEVKPVDLPWFQLKYDRLYEANMSTANKDALTFVLSVENENIPAASSANGNVFEAGKATFTRTVPISKVSGAFQAVLGNLINQTNYDFLGIPADKQQSEYTFTMKLIGAGGEVIGSADPLTVKYSGGSLTPDVPADKEIEVKPEEGSDGKTVKYATGSAVGDGTQAGAVKAEDVANMFKPADGFTGSVAVVDAKGDAIAADQPVGTGTTVQLLDDQGNVLDEIVVVIKGDTKGTGIVDAGSCIATRNSILDVMAGNTGLSGAFVKAADINGDGTVDTGDCIKTRNMIVV